MYKIYINETPLFLMNSAEIKEELPTSDTQVVSIYTGKRKVLIGYVDKMEKMDYLESVILHAKDYSKLVTDFNECFKIIQAAGGLVFNPKGEILMIHRRGFWDLPKGKIDPGEGITEAAIREVQEETGIKEVVLGESICETFHTYRSRKNKRILKHTFWYIMHTSDEELIPQIEEDIEEAVWLSPEEIQRIKAPIYKNIVEVLEKGILNKNSEKK